MRSIDGSAYFTALEIADFFDNHDGFEILDAADIVCEQLESDELTEDNFRGVLVYDAINGDFPLEHLNETLDLCDIVEAMEKGYILNE